MSGRCWSGILRCACVWLASAHARLYRVPVMIGNEILMTSILELSGLLAWYVFALHKVPRYLSILVTTRATR